MLVLPLLLVDIFADEGGKREKGERVRLPCDVSGVFFPFFGGR